MMSLESQSNQPHDFEALPTPDLLDRAETLARDDDTGQGEARWAAVVALRQRPEHAVFERAVAWGRSTNARDRALAADVLAQLGAPTLPFSAESTPTLLALLHDPDEDVVEEAIYALGHLRMGDASELGRFARHSSSRIREAVAHALGGREDAEAINALQMLTSDAARDVRDWATFGLGSLCESDSPQIRDALAARLSDEDDEIRGESIVGLARRADRRAISAILSELGRSDVLELVFEAAELMPSPDFVERLQAIVRSSPSVAAFRALERCERTLK